MLKLFTFHDKIDELVDELDFDLSYWMKIDSMGQLFEEAEAVEDEDPANRYLRYCDDDVCFDISFIYIADGIEKHPDAEFLYLDTSTGKEKFYIVEAKGEF